MARKQRSKGKRKQAKQAKRRAVGRKVTRARTVVAALALPTGSAAASGPEAQKSLPSAPVAIVGTGSGGTGTGSG